MKLTGKDFWNLTRRYPWPGRLVSAGKTLGLGAVALFLWGMASPAAAVTVNQPAPDFSLKSLSDVQFDLSGHRGKFLLLNFWATWCGPCKMEMASLEKLHRHFQTQDLAVIGISNDMFGARVVVPFMKAHGLTLPVLLDPTLEVSNRYEVVGLPTTILIDREGNVIGVLNGAEDWATPKTLRYFESLLAIPVQANRSSD